MAGQKTKQSKYKYYTKEYNDGFKKTLIEGTNEYEHTYNKYMD